MAETSSNKNKRGILQTDPLSPQGKSKKVTFSLEKDEKTEVPIQPFYNNQSDKSGEQLPEISTWKPPSGFNLSIPSKDRSIADFDNVENDSKELWLVRLPIGIDTSMLDGMTLKLPPQEHKETTLLATLQSKTNNEYTIHNIPFEEEASSSDSDSSDQGKQQKKIIFPVGCEEMHHTKCLLRSKRNNNNFILAPKEISRHIAITQLIDIPDPTQAALDILSKPRSPPEQPEGLKMQFKPYGFDTDIDKNKSKKKRSIKKNKQEEDDFPLQKKSKSPSSSISPLQSIPNRKKTVIDIPGPLTIKPAQKKSKNSGSKKTKLKK